MFKEELERAKNLIDRLRAENRSLRIERDKMRDEINRTISQYPRSFPLRLVRVRVLKNKQI